MIIQITDELERIRKEDKVVQVYINENYTPQAKLTAVFEDFIIIEEIEHNNAEVIIPMKKVVYVRPIK